ncbi:MAG TPA: malto-oligosyltrehalose synthase [Noviherbaspirillum sp.]|nr:malto-oligosyltrehalose synthase [Noviherbaspirillum sp.]
MSMPRATARLQLHKDFDFDAAAAVVPYYAALGISHIYASPILTARSGSTHGYDIVDPTRINPELGGEDGLRRMVAAIRQAGLGLILDIVPNHMGVGPENPWWQHVLEWGQNSPYARWFDIDWQPADETLHGKVMAPFLGQPYGDVLRAGEIRLCFDAMRGKFYIGYFDHRFPLAPADYVTVLRTAASERLAGAISAFENFRGDPGNVSQHNAEMGFARLRELAATGGQTDIEGALAHFSSENAAGQDALHALLERQHYRLAWWRCAADGINWRRFFEITDLVGVRVEQDDVFEATHALIFRLYSEGLIDGVRIDHVDGLADPGAYCRKLRARLQALSVQRPVELPPAPAYIVVEKILAHGEPLRQDWAIDGTSGYDFMDQVGALLHDPAGEAPLTLLWQEVTGSERDFLHEVRDARRQLLANNLSGEFEAATRALHMLARTDLRTRDFTLGAIRRVFAELLVHFPVYRTYADSNGRDELDQEVIERALEAARSSVERTEVPLLDVLARWLGGDAPADSANPRVRYLHQRAITRFQQLTPPLAAKSVEDTAFYRYGRLLSRNEVGSDPGQFSLTVSDFHVGCIGRAASFPRAMLTTATHDHKRGEDTRTRLTALSEMAQDWGRAVRDWMQANARLRTELPADNGGPPAFAPQPADELMLYQMLLGAWPIGLAPQDREHMQAFAERIERWQTKALREAKQVSDWVLPNEAYEAGCRDFLHRILGTSGQGGGSSAFLEGMQEWVRRTAAAGAAKSLVQTTLRLTVPGVPDLYQGADLWDFSMVDPDNRRPVDYPLRERLLADAPVLPAAALDDWESGRVKQHLIRTLLALRTRMPDLFTEGEYGPLVVEGEHAGRVIAFARRHREQMMVVVGAHLPVPLLARNRLLLDPAGFGGTEIVLPHSSGPVWHDALSGRKLDVDGGRVPLAQIFTGMPAAVLLAAKE